MFDKTVKQSKREKFSQVCSEQAGCHSNTTPTLKISAKKVSLYHEKVVAALYQKNITCFFGCLLLILSINFYCGKHKQC